MKKAIKLQQNQQGNAALDMQRLLALLAEKDRQLQEKDTLLNDKELLLQAQNKHLGDKETLIQKQQKYIQYIEEQLRLSTLRKFAASSEKMPWQGDLFDEVELEQALVDLEKDLPEKDRVIPRKKTRNRGFSDKLTREKVYLRLSQEERENAVKTFFTKVKEELEFIPAQMKVLEFWQEKAVFVSEGEESVVAAKRPTHPLGKCFAAPSLLAHVIAAKYADGLPLYRTENILKRYGADVSRTNMANWVIRLEEVFRPLINLMRECQLESDYLQADETRIQVLKESGKSATSDKWMWVARGGPPDTPVVLYEYDPSRSGDVPVRLLSGFEGVLQTDGYAGYNQVCKENNITRIGCWDHCRRKFVEAVRVAKPTKKTGKQSRAEQAVTRIRKLYAIEKMIKDLGAAEKKRIRQQQSLPLLTEFKLWLEQNKNRVLKNSQTYVAIHYCLNQWEYLTGYCNDGRLHISNALAENAIRPFAVGRRAWLFADTPKGACASATCYSLVETAKANGLEPFAYIRHVLLNIADADTLEKIEALLPWNADLEPFSKNVPQSEWGK